MENQRKFFDWLGEQLGCEEFEDWYSVKLEDCIELGASKLLSIYGSFPTALQTVYPERTVYPWKFSTLGKMRNGFWLQQENQMQFFNWLSAHLDIQSPEDWKRISFDCIISHGGNLPSFFLRIQMVEGGSMMRRSGGLFEMLSKFHPNTNTETFYNSNHIKKHQLNLLKIIKDLVHSLSPVSVQFFMEGHKRETVHL
jgi:hypothetical protein